MSAQPVRSGPEFDRRVAQYVARIERTIAKHEFAVQGVFPTVEDTMRRKAEGRPVPAPFAYTIGMTGKGLPELAVSGLDQETMAVILNLAGEVHQVNEILVGSELPLPLMTEVRMRIIDAPEIVAGIAQAVYPDSDLQFRQVVWPDDDGRYPGEPGHDAKTFRQDIFGGKRWWLP